MLFYEYIPYLIVTVTIRFLSTKKYSNSDDKGTSRNGGIDETRKKVIASPDPVSIHVSHPIQSNLDQKSASNQLQTLVQLAPPPLRNQRPTNNQRQNTGSALQNEDGRSWRKFVEAAKLISTSVIIPSSVICCSPSLHSPTPTPLSSIPLTSSSQMVELLLMHRYLISLWRKQK